MQRPNGLLQVGLAHVLDERPPEDERPVAELDRRFAVRQHPIDDRVVLVLDVGWVVGSSDRGHGVSFRTDPLAAFMVMMSLALLFGARSWFAMAAAGILAAIGLLVTVKAVDPEFYPFFGSVGLDPPSSLREVLGDDAAAVSQEFLIRTGSSMGNSIHIGAGQFRIAAILKSEPDRLASGVERIAARALLCSKARTAPNHGLALPTVLPTISTR